MATHGLPEPAVRLHEWFRRDVEGRLSAAVGGQARLRVIVLLACVLALDSADKATVGATAVQLESALHIGNTQLGLLVTCSTGIGAIATLPMGAFVDRVTRTRLLAGAILVWSAAMIASGASGSYLMLLVTRLALGAVVATAGPAIASLTGDFFPASERGRIYGFILAGELVGTGIGFLISGNVAALLSWRFSFWALAVPGFALAAAIWRLLPEPARGGQSRLPPGAEQITSAEQVEDGERSGTRSDPADDDVDEGIAEREVEEEGISPRKNLVLHRDPADRSLWWAVRYVLSIPTNVMLIIASALGYFFFAGLRTFAVAFLRGRFDIGQGSASTLLVVLGAGAIVGVLVAGRVGDRMIQHHHIAGRPIVAGVAFLLATVLLLPGMLTTVLFIAAPLFFLGAAGVGGANPPLDAARLDIMQHHMWGRAESVRTALRSAFEAIAPLLFGYVSTLFGGHNQGLAGATGSRTAVHGATGLDLTFLVMLTTLAAAGLLLLLRAARTYPRDVATAVASEHATRHPEPERR